MNISAYISGFSTIPVIAGVYGDTATAGVLTDGALGFVCFLFCDLATSKVISGQVPTCDSAHS